VPLSETPTPRGVIFLFCLLQEDEDIVFLGGTSKA
jgi:hypothetical protein